MRKEVILALFFFALFIIPSVKAEIVLSQPLSLYNLGDNFEINASIFKNVNVDGFFKMSIVCPSGSIVFFADYIYINANEEKSIEKSFPLKDVQGTCFMSAAFAGEEKKTADFVVTDLIKIEINVSNNHPLPGERVLIEGEAVKDNGIVNGFAEISISDIVKQTISVKNGLFSFAVDIPTNAKASEYALNIFVYEKLDEEITNKGNAASKLYIKSIPSKLDIALNNESFVPGSSILIKSSLYDQASQPIVNENVSIKIKNSRGEAVFERIILSDELLEYKFANGSVKGEWEVSAYSSGLTSSRKIYMEEYEAILTEFIDGRFVVTNIGNVPYKKPLEVRFVSNGKEVIEIKQLNINAGEVQEFMPTAPEGIYDLSVQDKTFNSVPLTGKVVSLVELKGKKSGLLVHYPIISFVIFILLIFTILFISRSKNEVSISRVDSFGAVSPPMIISKGISNIGNNVSREKKGYIIAKAVQDIKGKETNFNENNIKKIFEKYKDKNFVERIEQGAIHGKRQEISILFIDIRNFAEIKSRIGEGLDNFLNKYFRLVTNAVYSYRGVMEYIGGGEMFAIFNAPRVQEGHQLAATRAAVKIKEELLRLSYELSSFNLSIQFGIGISSGDAIVGSITADKKLKFMPIANISAIAQKIESKAKNDVLINKSVNDSVKNFIKTQRYGAIEFSGYAIEAFNVSGGSTITTSGKEPSTSSLSDMIAKIKKEEEIKEAEKRLKKGFE